MNNSKVIQKAMIEVEEEGTTAAVATVINIKARMGRPRVTQFNVDHPFLFFLRDLETGMLLFQGRIVDPTKET